MNTILVDIHTGRLIRPVLRRNIYPILTPGAGIYFGLVEDELQHFTLGDAGMFYRSAVDRILLRGRLGVSYIILDKSNKQE